MGTTSKKYQINRDCFLNPLEFGSTRLYQIGRLYCTSDTVIERHCQLNFFELTVVTGGEGTVITNGVEKMVREGDIHVSFAGDFHEIRSASQNPLKYDYLAINTVEPTLLCELDRIVESYHDESHRLIRDGEISALTAQAIAEINGGQIHSDIILSAIFDQIFVRLIRAFEKTDLPLPHKGASDAQMLCYRLMNYIDSHIYTMKSLNELSEVTSYNYNYISNLYKEVTGDTLMSYYRSKRLTTAKLLLCDGELGVSEIAGLLNYSSVYSFSRAFKAKYGVPPSRAR